MSAVITLPARSLVLVLAAGLCTCTTAASDGDAGGTGGGAGGKTPDAAAGAPIDHPSPQDSPNPRDVPADATLTPKDSAAPDTTAIKGDAAPPAPDAATPSGMKLIAGGTFTMGSNDTRDVAAAPPHRVTVSSFYMDLTEVTQEQYLAIMGVNPSLYGRFANLPVESVTWYDAILYCNERSKREGKDPVYEYTGTCVSGTPGKRCKGLKNVKADMSKNGYRLPTEAEWEYATRAGTTTSFFWGEDTDKRDGTFTKGGEDYCWYWRNAGRRTHPVATKLPNPWGLFDMSGNIYEWVNDWAAPYKAGAETDPTGPPSGIYKIARGGSYYDVNLIDNRSAMRWLQLFDPNGTDQPEAMGFRTVRSAR